MIPIVPLAVLFDGLVSCLRTHTPAEMRDLAHLAKDAYEYVQDIGQDRETHSPVPVIYRIGYPRHERKDQPA